MPSKKSPPGLASKSKTKGGEDATKKGRPKYIKLKKPSDVMAYVQTLINRLRENDQEIEQLGKITNLLNTWISAHKDMIETEDLRKLRDEVDDLKEQLKQQ